MFSVIIHCIPPDRDPLTGLTTITVYFLPIWFQAVTQVSPVESGIRTIPLVIATVAGQISGGISSAKIGYYTQWAIAGTCFMAIGVGLLTTLQVDTSKGKWIGYQIIYGLGFGWSFQVPNLAMMTSLPKKDLPMGFALNLFVSLLCATVFVAIGENVLANQLLQRLSGTPGFRPTSSGTTSLLDALPADQRAASLVAYNEALRKVFIIGLVPCCLSVLGAVTLEWKNIKKVKAAQAAEEEAAISAKEAEQVGKSEKTGGT